jgi:DNA-binding HxlR family transcriptional regulator
MLTQTLRELEREGLILRTVSRATPLEVHYQLTALGVGLAQVMQTVVDWAEQHVDEMGSARNCRR